MAVDLIKGGKAYNDFPTTWRVGGLGRGKIIIRLLENMNYNFSCACSRKILKDFYSISFPSTTIRFQVVPIGQQVIKEIIEESAGW